MCGKIHILCNENKSICAFQIYGNSFSKLIKNFHVSFQEDKVTGEMPIDSSKALGLNIETAPILMTWIALAQIPLKLIALG